MYKVVGICGEPATGKSAIVRRIMENQTPEWIPEKLGTMVWSKNERTGLTVLGIYEEGVTFAGTDRLSMAVAADAELFFRQADSLGCNKILFEGDRLFYVKLITHIISTASEFLFINLMVKQEELEQRRAARVAIGQVQSAQFLKGRHTKYVNLRNTFPFIRGMKHNDEFDQDQIIHTIQGVLS